MYSSIFWCPKIRKPCKSRVSVSSKVNPKSRQCKTKQNNSPELSGNSFVNIYSEDGSPELLQTPNPHFSWICLDFFCEICYFRVIIGRFQMLGAVSYWALLWLGGGGGGASPQDPKDGPQSKMKQNSSPGRLGHSLNNIYNADPPKAKSALFLDFFGFLMGNLLFSADHWVFPGAGCCQLLGVAVA